MARGRRRRAGVLAAAALRGRALSAAGAFAGRTAIVLPPGEGFGADAVGAIGLLAHRLSGPDDVVLGRATPMPPFGDRGFVAVRPAGWPLPGARLRHMVGVARMLRDDPPALAEVHNRPEQAMLLARRLPGLPVLLVLHNDPRAMRLADTPAARRALLRRVRVAAVSDWVGACFAEGLDPGTAVAILPNCLDLSALPAPLPAAAREQTILFVGRPVADKGADRFVAACAAALPLLPGWRAEIIGADRFRADSPDTPFLRALRPAAVAAGVALSGHQPHAAVLAAMARAAIVVVPSVWPEPFGLTALEAMASGAALLASGRGGLAALTEGASVRIDPDRPGAIAEAIVALAADPVARARLGEAGRARSRGFDLPAARDRLRALRAATIAGGGR